MASSFNSMLFLSLLVAISALIASPSIVEAQLVQNNVINVTGTVRCAINPTLLPNGSLSGTPFGNATVQLRCADTTVATTTTNANGMFSIIIDPAGRFLQALLTYYRTARNCKVVVTTPLFNCSSTLPRSGTLVSSLTRGPINRVGDTRMLIIYAKSFVYAD